MAKCIRYFGSYGIDNITMDRYYSIAGSVKMRSICKIINATGRKVEVVSGAAGNADNFKFLKAAKYSESPDWEIRLQPSICGRGFLARTLRYMIRYIANLAYIIKNVKHGDAIIVYHSLGYGNVFNILKNIKKYILIYEVEELYRDVIGTKHFGSKSELKNLKYADAFIFPTDLLGRKVNICGKPELCIYGAYDTPEKLLPKFDDGKIHIIYGGTLDPRKGVKDAALAIKYLPENYHLHICGFGSENEEELIRSVINESLMPGHATATFEGVLLGDDYLNLLQRCHIGLSPQKPDASFNATSFPSKILAYMKNGLDVVSIDIPSIKASRIAPYITFYSEQSPQAIAEACMSLNPGRYDMIRVVEELNVSFTSELDSLLNKFGN